MLNWTEPSRSSIVTARSSTRPARADRSIAGGGVTCRPRRMSMIAESAESFDLRGDLRIDPPGVDSSAPALTSWLRIMWRAALACLTSRSMSCACQSSYQRLRELIDDAVPTFSSTPPTSLIRISGSCSGVKLALSTVGRLLLGRRSFRPTDDESRFLAGLGLTCRAEASPGETSPRADFLYDRSSSGTSSNSRGRFVKLPSESQRSRAKGMSSGGDGTGPSTSSCWQDCAEVDRDGGSDAPSDRGPRGLRVERVDIALFGVRACSK